MSRESRLPRGLEDAIFNVILARMSSLTTDTAPSTGLDAATEPPDDTAVNIIANAAADAATEFAPESAPGPPTFHYFSSLPTELRLKIWGFALPDPQTIRYHPGRHDHDPPQHISTTTKDKPTHCLLGTVMCTVSNSGATGLAWACTESRHFLLHESTYAWYPSCANPGCPFPTSAQFLASPARDVFYISDVQVVCEQFMQVLLEAHGICHGTGPLLAPGHWMWGWLQGCRRFAEPREPLRLFRLMSGVENVVADATYLDAAAVTKLLSVLRQCCCLRRLDLVLHQIGTCTNPAPDASLPPAVPGSPAESLWLSTRRVNVETRPLGPKADYEDAVWDGAIAARTELRTRLAEMRTQSSGGFGTVMVPVPAGMNGPRRDVEIVISGLSVNGSTC